MISNTRCTFCKVGITGLLYELPSKFENGPSIPCKRGIYEDDYCIGTLTPEQYTIGHTLLVLKTHREDITDPNISGEELSGFITAIHRVTNHLRNKARNDRDEAPSRIHVLSLCDGIKHLHAHLIPRYCYDESEREFYVENYWDREKDNWKSKGDFRSAGREGKIEIHGMWYAAYHEMEYKNSRFWKCADTERAWKLQVLAQKLRIYGGGGRA